MDGLLFSQLAGEHGQNGVLVWRPVVMVFQWDQENVWLELTAVVLTHRKSTVKYKTAQVSNSYK